MVNATSNSIDSEKLSQLRKRIVLFRKEQDEIINNLLDAGPMIVGSFYQVYKTCTKPNCCCRHGQKHGPYAALSFTIKGKHFHKTIRKDAVDSVREKSAHYKGFQKNHARLRETNRQIDILLEQLRNAVTGEYT